MSLFRICLQNKNRKELSFTLFSSAYTSLCSSAAPSSDALLTGFRGFPLKPKKNQMRSIRSNSSLELIWQSPCAKLNFSRTLIQPSPETVAPSVVITLKIILNHLSAVSISKAHLLYSTPTKTPSAQNFAPFLVH